jgi:putative endonuclease
MGINQSVGKKGEEAALAFLKKKGYKIEATNYRTTTGEIDIIARDKSVLVFIEVKTRKSPVFGLPYEAVHHHKQAKIRLVAGRFLAEKACGCGDCRFDVISILLSATGDYKIEHIENAF